jgi:hypothetical protein
MAGRLLRGNGRLQRNAGKLVRSVAGSCSCCGKTLWVQLRPCCIGSFGSSPYPPTEGTYFATEASLESLCTSASPFGTIRYGAAGGGTATFCMYYDKDADAPIPTSALPPDAVDLSPNPSLDECESGARLCNEDPLTPPEDRLCPACPDCCITAGLTDTRCVPNTLGCLGASEVVWCGYGRAYNLTFNYQTETTTEVPRGICSQDGVTVCEPDPLQRTKNTTQSFGTMNFRRDCDEGDVYSCTGEWTFKEYVETRTRGSPPPGSGCAWPSPVTTVTTDSTTTYACSTFLGLEVYRQTILDIPLPGTAAYSCAGTHLDEVDCNGQLLYRTETEWNLFSDCFQGNMRWERVSGATVIDSDGCSNFECAYSASVVPSCVGLPCYRNVLSYSLDYTIDITSYEDCGGPWEAIRRNYDNGCLSEDAGNVLGDWNQAAEWGDATELM